MPKDLSPEGQELLIEIMRQRLTKIDAEVARLLVERDQVAAWLKDNATDQHGTGSCAS